MKRLRYTGRGRIRKVLYALGFIVFGAAAAYGETPAPSTNAEQHESKGITCEGCHGTGPKQPVEMEQCLQCHVSYKKVAEQTKDLDPNPHDSHLLELECTVCHLGHKPFVLYCNTCHQDMTIGRKK